MSTIVQTEETVIKTVSDEEGARRERLLRAAEIIEERGWSREGFGLWKDAKVCILGAVWWAGHPNDTTALKDGGRYHESAENVGEEWSRVVEWNDDGEATSGEQVAQTLRRLANGATWEEAIS